MQPNIPAQADRAFVWALARSRYGTVPDYPWQRHPGYGVLRHSHNRKWYAVVMDLPRSTLALPGSGRVDAMNVKLGLMAGAFLQQPGILPAYHMAKGSWVTVLLDGTVPPQTVELLLDISFEQTAAKNKKPQEKHDGSNALF